MPKLKTKILIRLGVDPDHAYAWSRTREGTWAVAKSPILVQGQDYAYTGSTVMAQDCFL